MKSFFAAIRFLTIIPVPERWCGGEAELRRSVGFFPVVGLLVGLLVSCAVIWGERLFPSSLLAVIAVILFIGISGGLHMDGLADTADGFLSARPRERILEIMRDSRSGPMGIIAIVCLLLLKVETLAVLTGSQAWWAVILIPLAGRCAIVVQMSWLPYARPSGGLAAVFCQPRRHWPSVWAIGFFAVAGWYLARWNGLLAVGLSLLMALLFSGWCYRKLGGFTGDTLGAVCEITETVPALVAAAAAHRQWIG